jgi:aryl-phospho-beta-D-glucosidase BglC (GH1 family)
MLRKSLVVILLLLPLSLMASAQATRAVPDARYARLAKSINLPFWFWYGPNTQTGIENHYANEEFDTLVAIGITAVRVPINLPYVHDANAGNHLNDGHVTVLKSQIQRLTDAGLAVIIDIHTTDENQDGFSYWLENDPNFAAEFAAFWQSFAGSMAATFSADDIFFEVLNEPIFYDSPETWPPIQETLAAAIRAGAPNHTIIVGGAWWNSYITLQDLTPLADSNVIYTFHFYEPFVFTHQGATWAGSDVQPLRNIPYPSSPAIIAPLLNNYVNPARAALQAYGNANWNATKVSNLIGEIADWGSNNGVRLLAGEFGVYKTYAPKADRAALIHDVRTALEANGIAWAMWDYDNSFGLFTRQNNAPPRIDAAIANALGLDASAALSVLPYLEQTYAGFNDPLDPLGPFKLKRPSNGDGAFCDLTGGYYDGECAVVLTGDPEQDTKLILTWSGTELKQAGLNKGDSIELRFDWLPATPDADLLVKLVISYSDGRASTVSKQRLTDESYGWLLPSAIVTASTRKITSVKAILRDRTQSGTTFIDRMNLYLLQGGTRLRILPLPVR